MPDGGVPGGIGFTTARGAHAPSRMEDAITRNAALLIRPGRSLHHCTVKSTYVQASSYVADEPTYRAQTTTVFAPMSDVDGVQVQVEDEEYTCLFVHTPPVPGPFSQNEYW